MVYNGFVVVDTRDNTGTESNYESNYPGEPGGDKTPLPGIGGGTSSGTAGWNNPTTTIGPSPAPSSGGGGGGGWQQWVNPQTIGAGVQLFGSVANMVAAGKTPDKVNIKAACGRKPLFNKGGKKDAYQQCVQRILTPQQPVYIPSAPTRMSTTSKALIGAGIFLFLLMIVIVVIMMNKGKAVAKA